MNVKAGYRTTEFWVTLLSVFAPIVLNVTGVDITAMQGDLAQGLAGVSTIAYILARLVHKSSIAKLNATSAPVQTPSPTPGS